MILPVRNSLCCIQQKAIDIYNINHVSFHISDLYVKCSVTEGKNDQNNQW